MAMTCVIRVNVGDDIADMMWLERVWRVGCDEIGREYTHGTGVYSQDGSTLAVRESA